MTRVPENRNSTVQLMTFVVLANPQLETDPEALDGERGDLLRAGQQHRLLLLLGQHLHRSWEAVLCGPLCAWSERAQLAAGRSGGQTRT